MERLKEIGETVYSKSILSKNKSSKLRSGHMAILIKNGTVFDPTNNINGEKMDIAIKDGKIVEKVNSNAKVIDASKTIVMPGGVDLHAHIAGSKVNGGRLFRPEDHRYEVYARTATTRGGVGHSVP
jgi:formylmethanofuran dehydrogenase subunit A